MKSSSISYRVADFLKQHPPFSYMAEEDLIALAMGGRVKFHESGEFVFEQGRNRGSFLFVIQQGTVELVEKIDDRAELRDLRGEGDLLGVGTILGEPVYAHTAITKSDVILYAIPASDFGDLIRKVPRARRYLAAYFSVHSSSQVSLGTDERSEIDKASGNWATWMNRRVEWEPAAPPTCHPGDSIRKAAKIMSQCTATRWRS